MLCLRLVDGLDSLRQIVSEYFLSVYSFRLCQGSCEYVQGWETGIVVHSCQHTNAIPTPLVLGVGGEYVP